MKKVFFINCADFGSTGKIIRDTVAVLKRAEWQTVLCVPKQTQNNELFDKVYAVSMKYEQGLYYRLGRISGNKYGIAPISTVKVIKAIKIESPDIVHIHCANGCFVNIYKLLKYLKKNNIPTVVTNHAEFYYTGYCDHAYSCNKWQTGCGSCHQKNALIDKTAWSWKMMKKSFCGFDKLVVTSVSPWVYSRSTASPILDGVEQMVVENGIDTDVFRVYDENQIDCTARKSTESKTILHVTSHFYGESEQKGSKYILEMARRLKNVTILVAGPHSNVEVPENVKLLGRISNQVELAKLYSAADISVVTGERESYSMPVAESLCCGTPVVGFRAGGPESIAVEKYSEFFEYGDMNSMVESIENKWLNFKNTELQKMISDVACLRYSKEEMGEKYLQIYRSLT